MDVSAVATTTAAVIWLIASLLVVVVGLFALITPDDIQDIEKIIFLPSALLVTIGAAVLALHVMGLVRTALWVWRIGSLFALAVIVRTAVSQGIGTRPGRLQAGIAVVAVALLGASFIARQPLVGAAVTAESAVTAITIDGVRMWHGIALAILAVATLVFLALFVRMIERGISPQVESNWGGIGGGVAGWRVSASLTYLAAAAVFGVLFALFVLQLESRAPQTTTGTPPSAVSPPPSGVAPATGGSSPARPPSRPGT